MLRWHIKNILDKIEENVNKSQFIEIFGDPAFNTKGWDEVELVSLLRAKPSNGFFAKNDEYCEDGNARVMWLSDVINRMYSNTKGLKRVNVSEKELDKYRVEYGDLLFCRSSLNKDGIGKATAVPPDIDDCTMFECHVIRTPLDLGKCIPEFMQIQTTLDYFRNQVFSKSKTATMTTIGQEGIVSTKVIVPPLEKQKEFVNFISQVDKLKFEWNRVLSDRQAILTLSCRNIQGELF